MKILHYMRRAFGSLSILRSLSILGSLSILCTLSVVNSPPAVASHSFGGLDMCALYPEVMPPGLTPDQLPDAGSKTAVLMQTYCTQCHELPGPGRHTAEEWPLVFDRMLMVMDVAEKFGGLLGKVKAPAADEREQLRSYLLAHALKPMTIRPHGAGASTFENHCSACHALPDPARYKNVDWSDVIKRMQHNMQVMKYSPPSAENMMQIQLFLLRNAIADNTEQDMATNHFTLTMTGDSVNFNDREINSGSWLSLGLFLLLAFIGLLRWWNSHQQIIRSGRIKQVKGQK